MTEATDNVEAVAETPDANVTTESVETSRPEWLPEKFKTPEDLVTSYSNLESRMGKGEEDIRTSIMEEIEGEAFANRPETSGDYALPEGTEEIAEDLANDPNVEWWSNFAWENGFSQDEFEEGLQRMIPQGPDLEAEAAKLGDNSSARIEAVSLWAQKNVPEEMSDAVMAMGESAAGVELLEHFMSMNDGVNLSGEGSTAAGLSQDELRSMMQDPRYWDNTRRDPGFVKQVDEGFSKLYK